MKNGLTVKAHSETELSYTCPITLDTYYVYYSSSYRPGISVHCMSTAGAGKFFNCGTSNISNPYAEIIYIGTKN